jgi:aminoglycoside phosphotransferase (APT) family kinase protein
VSPAGAAPADALELERWLRASGRIGPRAHMAVLRGGVSSLVAEVCEGTDHWVVKSPLARLSVADEWRVDRSRGAHEAAVLAHLDGRLGPARVPRLRFFDPDRTVLGEELVAGPPPAWEPAPSYKTELLAGRAHLPVASALGAAAGALHRTPPPPALAGDGPRRLFDDLRLDPYYRATAARRPEVADHLAALVRETAAHPAQHLVHGDLSPKNVLVAPGPPVLLDWEVVHAGDPSFDVGMLSAHLALKALRDQPAEHRAGTLRALRAFWDAYDGPADPGRSLRHTGGIMLARLFGKSPVEYLTGEAERDRAHAVGREALCGGLGGVGDLVAAVQRAAGHR